MRPDTAVEFAAVPYKSSGPRLKRDRKEIWRATMLAESRVTLDEWMHSADRVAEKKGSEGTEGEPERLIWKGTVGERRQARQLASFANPRDYYVTNISVSVAIALSWQVGCRSGETTAQRLTSVEVCVLHEQGNRHTSRRPIEIHLIFRPGLALLLAKNVDGFAVSFSSGHRFSGNRPHIITQSSTPLPPDLHSSGNFLSCTLLRLLSRL